MRICPCCDKRCKSVRQFCVHYAERHSEPRGIGIVIGEVLVDYYDTTRRYRIACPCGKEFQELKDFVKHVRKSEESFVAHFGADRVLDFVDGLGDGR